MVGSGRVNFGIMGAVVFGKPAAEAVAEEARRLSATRVFLTIAERAMGTPWVPRNPRPIKGPEEVREILELAA